MAFDSVSYGNMTLIYTSLVNVTECYRCIFSTPYYFKYKYITNCLR